MNGDDEPGCKQKENKKYESNTTVQLIFYSQIEQTIQYAIGTEYYHL